MIKVAVLTYPMLFQRDGGLQIQIRETLAALQRQGVDARLINPYVEKLGDFDLVHIFAAANGNHRAAELAKQLDIPIVTSPLLQPIWSRRFGFTARLLEALVGRLTGWVIKTEYRQIEICLQLSSRVFALSNHEKRCIVEGFGLPNEKIEVVPNGVPERFFSAQPANVGLCRADLGDSVLIVSSVNRYKNQLGLINALRGTGIRVSIIGPCLLSDEPYLAECLASGDARYFGSIDHADPKLVAAYAAARVFCLPSMSEVTPLCVVESLAAGTPVVMTKRHSMDLKGFEDVIIEVDPDRPAEMRAAIERFFRSPPSSGECQAAVRGFTWEKVGAKLHAAYQAVLDQ